LKADAFISRNLPLLKYLIHLFYDLNLKNTLIISVQHLCSTTEALFDALFQLHLEPRNLYVIGKCYSTNPKVLLRLRSRGVNALFSSSFFNYSVPFDLDFDQNINKMIEQVIASNDLFSYDRVIILDDGGHLLEKANELLSKELPIIGIEQTSSGFNRIKKFLFQLLILQDHGLSLNTKVRL
jgi:hypothetical protein